MESHSRAWTAGLVLALLWLGAVLSIHVARPFTGSHDADSAIWSQAAHNNLRAGLAATKGVPSSWHFRPLPIPPQGYYVHHPPGLSLLVTASFALFGEREWAARLVPIAATLAGVVLLWLLVRDAIGPRGAMLATALLVVLPMEMYFGRAVIFETVVLPLLLGALLAARRFEREPGPGPLALAVGLFALAMASGWQAYVVAGLAAVRALLRRDRRGRTLALAFAATGAASLALFVIQVHLVRPDAIQELGRAFLFRSGETVGGDGRPVRWGEWLAKMGSVLGTHIQPTAWVLAAAGALVALRRRAAGAGASWLGGTALLLAMATSLYLVVFRNASYIHTYMSFYFVAPVAMTGGLALEALLGAARERGRGARLGAVAAVGTLLVLLGFQGLAKVRSLHAYQYWIVGRTVPEPPDLIPALGRTIAETFPEEAKVHSNLPRKGTQLRYYAQRPIEYGVDRPEEWRALLAKRGEPMGALLWMGAPNAEALRDLLPSGSGRTVELGSLRFYLWRPESRPRSRAP